MNFSPSKEQETAFKKVAKAIKDAQKIGLVFYGKSGSLVAYTKQADKYNNEVDFQETLGTGLNEVDFISQTGLISDSGADDYACYRSVFDQNKYS